MIFCDVPLFKAFYEPAIDTASHGVGYGREAIEYTEPARDFRADRCREMVAIFEREAAAGHFPPVHVGHSGPMALQVVGEVVALRFNETTEVMSADIEINGVDHARHSHVSCETMGNPLRLASVALLRTPIPIHRLPLDLARPLL